MPPVTVEMIDWSVPLIHVATLLIEVLMPSQIDVMAVQSACAPALMFSHTVEITGRT